MNGTIIKVNNRYRAFFSFGGKRTSKYFATKRDAENWLAQCRVEQTNGTFCEPSKMTVGQWVVEWMTTYTTDTKPRTLDGYAWTMKNITAILDVPLQKLTPFHIQKTLNGIKSPSMRPKVYSFLSVIFKKAVKLHIIAYNPLSAVERPKYHGKERKPFTGQELKAIKPILAKNKYGNVFLTMLATGCRIGEVLALKIHNVHPTHIHIDSTAGRTVFETGSPKSLSSVRDIPIPKSVYEMLYGEWQKHGTLGGYVFASPNGTHYGSKAMPAVWKAILEEAGVEYRPPHTLRHTHATELLHHFDFVEVQHRLGHSAASITLNTYGHTKDDTTSAIVSVVDALVK